MNIVAIIPARLESSRFPGKPLKEIHGKPMIGHCLKRTQLCSEISETYVATCNQEIYQYVESIGGKAIMTSSSHERASDRTAEAMLKIESTLKKQIDIVVMVQGDEPMITPEMISAAIQPFYEDKGVNVVNLMGKIKSIEEFNDPNEVKVVADLNNNAIYFSRESINSMHKQICIIPFRRDYLIKFNEMEETSLEIIESIDMLRVIENGEKVKMVMTDADAYSVDTPDDLIKVQQKMVADSLMSNYLKLI